MKFYEYPKIPTLFERLTDGSKLLNQAKFISPIFEQLKDIQWQATEKLDGTNVGIYWDGHKIHIQGRTPNASFTMPQTYYLMDKFGGPVNEELFEQNFGEKEVVLYGELVGKGIQACGGCYNPDGVTFVMFDVYFPEKHLWADQSARVAFASLFGVDFATTSCGGTLQECIDYVCSLPESAHGHLVAEGVVVRPMVEMYDNQGKRVIAKIKARDFCSAQDIKAKDMEYRKNG